MPGLNANDILKLAVLDELARRERERGLDSTRGLDWTGVRIPMKDPALMGSPVYELAEPESRPDNILYRALSNPQLNSGLNNLIDNAYDVIMGEGTGNVAEDIALGFTGPGAAVGTIAEGNRPGLVDFTGTGGLLKGAVLATPKIAKIVQNTAGRVRGDAAVDAVYGAAQKAVERLAKESPAPATFDDLSEAIKSEIAGLGEIKNPEQLEAFANEYARKAMLRTLHNVNEGKGPALSVSTDPLLNVGYNAAENQPVAVKKAKNVSSATEYRKRNLAAFESFPDDVKEEIERTANAARAAARAAAIERGITDSQKLASIASGKYNSTKLAEITKMRKSMETTSEPNEILPVRTSSDNEVAEKQIADYAQGVWREATRQATEAGLSPAEVTRAGSIARDRARKAKAREIGGDVWKARETAAKNSQHNLRYIYSILSPDLKREVDESVKNVSGAKAQAAKFKYIRSIIQDMGFRSPNDLAINNYKVLGRYPELHVPKPDAMISSGPILDAALRKEAEDKARLTGEDFNFIYDILTGKNNGDPDAIELYDMMFPK